MCEELHKKGPFLLSQLDLCRSDDKGGVSLLKGELNVWEEVSPGSTYQHKLKVLMSRTADDLNVQEKHRNTRDHLLFNRNPVSFSTGFKWKLHPAASL